jgi:hypothetical protein
MAGNVFQESFFQWEIFIFNKRKMFKGAAHRLNQQTDTDLRETSWAQRNDRAGLIIHFFRKLRIMRKVFGPNLPTIFSHRDHYQRFNHKDSKEKRQPPRYNIRGSGFYLGNPCRRIAEDRVKSINNMNPDLVPERDLIVVIV